MKYIATYELTPEVEKLIIKGFVAAICNDGYYLSGQGRRLSAGPYADHYPGTAAFSIPWGAEKALAILGLEGCRAIVNELGIDFDEFPYWYYDASVNASIAKIAGVIAGVRGAFYEESPGPWRWLTCAGNYEGVKIYHAEGTITYARHGNRHGITNYWGALEAVAPLSIVEYTTERPDASPWAAGLLPSPERMAEKAARVEEAWFPGGELFGELDVLKKCIQWYGSDAALEWSDIVCFVATNFGKIPSLRDVEARYDELEGGLDGK